MEASVPVFGNCCLDLPADSAGVSEDNVSADVDVLVDADVDATALVDAEVDATALVLAEVDATALVDA